MLDSIKKSLDPFLSYLTTNMFKLFPWALLGVTLLGLIVSILAIVALATAGRG